METTYSEKTTFFTSLLVVVLKSLLMASFLNLHNTMVLFKLKLIFNMRFDKDSTEHYELAALFSHLNTN